MQSRFDLPRYTYNDYKNWKEDWELIDGYPIQVLPSAVWKHSLTLSLVSTQANNSIRKIDCNCMVFVELDWKISEETVVRPDMMVVCGELVNDFLEFPPILVLEILSPSTIKNDRTIKFEIYREQGVKYYLLADYIKKAVEVYQLVDNFYKQVEISKFQLDKTCEIEFDFESIWK
jgi:Uma2 family endonuclease